MNPGVTFAAGVKIQIHFILCEEHKDAVMRMHYPDLYTAASILHPVKNTMYFIYHIVKVTK